jgi:hypothetical protein
MAQLRPACRPPTAKYFKELLQLKRGTENELQKRAKPGILPGLRLVQGSEGCAREFTPPPVVGSLGRSYGVGNSVVYNGESISRAISDGAAQKPAQKSALRRRPVFQIAKDAPEIRSREA